MPLDLDDVKSLAEQTIVVRMHERMKRLLDEKIEVLGHSTTATDRLQQIDNELAGIETRLKSAAREIRRVLAKIDPSGRTP